MVAPDSVPFPRPGDIATCLIGPCAFECGGAGGLSKRESEIAPSRVSRHPSNRATRILRSREPARRSERLSWADGVYARVPFGPSSVQSGSESAPRITGIDGESDLVAIALVDGTETISKKPRRRETSPLNQSVPQITVHGQSSECSPPRNHHQLALFWGRICSVAAPATQRNSPHRQWPMNQRLCVSSRPVVDVLSNSTHNLLCN
jgi:hypothetical protein